MWIASTAELSAYSVVIAAIIGTGGLSALLLLKPQRDSMIAAAAEQAIKSVTMALTDTQAALAAQRERLIQVESQLAEAREEIARMKSEAAKVAAQTHHKIDDNSVKLDEIHELVDGSMVTALQNEIDAIERELALMEEVVDLKRAAGREPVPSTLKAIADTKAIAGRLRQALEARSDYDDHKP